jgi:hypothetical protein
MTGKSPLLQMVVGVAWHAMRARGDCWDRFAEQASRTRSATAVTQALKERKWFKADLPFHRRKAGTVDFTLPLAENPLHAGMTQVHHACREMTRALNHETPAVVCVVGASGVGKTASAFELLGQQWGLYLAAVYRNALRLPRYGAPANFLQKLSYDADQVTVEKELCLDLVCRLLVLFLARHKGVVKTPLDWLIAQLEPSGAGLVVGNHCSLYSLPLFLPRHVTSLWLLSTFVHA